MDDERAAIVTFDLAEVAENKEEMLRLFSTLDDDLNMPTDFKVESAKALLRRILAHEEIHLLAGEALFLKEKAPKSVLKIIYYDS